MMQKQSKQEAPKNIKPSKQEIPTDISITFES
jgi:hypothetical protein